MRRRDLIKGVAGSAIAWPLAARAQQNEQMRRVGIFMGGLDDPLGQARATALVQGLGEFNWHDGGNLRIDWRWAGGNPALYERYAAELIALDPEVLVVWGSPSVAALRRRTSTIPIVLVNVTDPVGQGFVESLAHPGGNITGFTDYVAIMELVEGPVSFVDTRNNQREGRAYLKPVETVTGGVPFGRPYNSPFSVR